MQFSERATGSVPRTVLTCLALSPSAADVAARGLRMAWLLDARPVFLHVGDDTEANRKALAAVLARAGALDTSELLFRKGYPYAAICQAAQEINAWMIVLGALARDPLLVGVWGSIARQVARGAPCSVLLMSGTMNDRPGGQTVVASVRTDERSEAMVHVLLDMSRRGGIASIHFVREFPVNEAHWASGGTLRQRVTVDDYIKMRIASERAMLVDFLAGFDLGETPVRASTIVGREGTEIRDYAEAQKADLLVVQAPRGRRLGFWSRMLHHPAEAALGRLTCPLLIFRDRSR